MLKSPEATEASDNSDERHYEEILQSPASGGLFQNDTGDVSARGACINRSVIARSPPASGGTTKQSGGVYAGNASSASGGLAMTKNDTSVQEARASTAASLRVVPTSVSLPDLIPVFTGTQSSRRCTFFWITRLRRVMTFPFRHCEGVRRRRTTKQSVLDDGIALPACGGLAMTE